MDVSVVGLGKLGAPLAVALAARGHQVIGVDRCERTITLVNQGQAPVYEPGLDALIAQARPRLTATPDIADAVARTALTFIVVPTPSNATGSFSLEHVLPAARSIGRALRTKPGFHVVVLTSTVMPGDSADRVLPALEKASGKRCSVDFGLCYNPEFIALGSVLHDMANPDFVLIGESDPRSGDRLAELLRSLCDDRPPIRRMTFANAELTKLAVNTYVTTKITYANMLAELCEKLPGGDVDVVTAAVGLDTRIGPKYLKAAMPYGGPCFPRDNRALATLAENLGVRATLPTATDRANRRQALRLERLVKAHLEDGSTVGILGLTYKPGTNVLERAPGLALARALANDGIPLRVYDPVPLPSIRELIPGDVVVARSAVECTQEAEVVVICTPYPEFRAIANEAPGLDRQTVIDCWRLLDAEQAARFGRYVAPGRFDTMQPALERLIS